MPSPSLSLYQVGTTNSKHIINTMSGFDFSGAVPIVVAEEPEEEPKEQQQQHEEVENPAQGDNAAAAHDLQLDEEVNHHLADAVFGADLSDASEGEEEEDELDLSYSSSGSTGSPSASVTPVSVPSPDSAVDLPSDAVLQALSHPDLPTPQFELCLYFHTLMESGHGDRPVVIATGHDQNGTPEYLYCTPKQFKEMGYMIF